MHVCRYTHNDTLPTRLRELLEDRAFSFFYGRQESDAPAPHHRLRRRLDDLLSRADVAHLTTGNAELAEAAAHRVVALVGEVWEASTRAGSVVEEEALLRRLEAAAAGFPASPADPALLRDALQLTTARYPQRATGWSYFARELETAGSMDSASILAAFLQMWRVHFSHRRQEVERQILLRGVQSFLRRLRRELTEARQTQERVADLLGIAGGFWDLLEGGWEQTEWGSLEEAATLLREQPTVRELAAILGRGLHAEVEYAAVTEEQLIEERHVHDEVLGRSEVEGITMGHSVETMLPSEAALLSDDATELVFAKRYADDGLLSLNYRRMDEHVNVTFRTERRERLIPKERGPIIACIDTSGSMTGRPERVAKAASLALAEAALAEGRRCYLISFSTGINTLEISELPRDLPALSEFLSHSFHGGTDLRPALREAVRMVGTEQFQRADVITLSDFKVPKIADRLSEELQRARDAHGTVFHSLTVNESPVIDPLHLFDFRWHYDISHPESEGVVLGRFAKHAGHGPRT